MRLPALLYAVACDISFACNVLSICKLFSSHLFVSPLCFCCCYAFRLFSVSPMEIGKKFNWVINELQANFNAQFHCYPLPHAVAATTLSVLHTHTPAYIHTYALQTQLPVVRFGNLWHVAVLWQVVMLVKWHMYLQLVGIINLPDSLYVVSSPFSTRLCISVCSCVCDYECFRYPRMFCFFCYCFFFLLSSRLFRNFYWLLLLVTCCQVNKVISQKSPLCLTFKWVNDCN